jgi:hypothetical protein
MLGEGTGGFSGRGKSNFLSLYHLVRIQLPKPPTDASAWHLALSGRESHKTPVYCRISWWQSPASVRAGAGLRPNLDTPRNDL